MTGCTSVIVASRLFLMNCMVSDQANMNLRTWFGFYFNISERTKIAPRMKSET